MGITHLFKDSLLYGEKLVYELVIDLCDVLKELLVGSKPIFRLHIGVNPLPKINLEFFEASFVTFDLHENFINYPESTFVV